MSKQIRADLIAGLAAKHDIDWLGEAAIFSCAETLNIDALKLLRDDAGASGDSGMWLATQELIAYAE